MDHVRNATLARAVNRALRLMTRGTPRGKASALAAAHFGLPLAAVRLRSWRTPATSWWLRRWARPRERRRPRRRPA
jgi:hypothetical protein